MRNSISISNYVNVSTIILPSGLPQFNPNIVGFFTTENFINGNQTDVYRNYQNAKSVATDFGTNSNTYALASLIFAQSPNIRSGGGSLNIIPMLGSVSATSEFFTTANIAANLANIILVSDGSITITVDGVVFNLTNLDFTRCATWQDVANVFLKYLQGYANVDLLLVGNVPSGLIFSSKKVGTSSQITLATLVGGTDITGATYLNVVGGATTNGTASTGETLLEATVRTADEVQYFPFFTNLAMEDNYILETATATQALPKMYMQEIASLVDVATTPTLGIAWQIADANLNKTRVLGNLSSPSLAQKFKVAYTGRMFSVDFTGNNTALTANLKQLSGIPSDTVINDSILQTLINAGVDSYPNTAGQGFVNAQGNANDYFDNQYNAGWFENTLQVNLFNVLATTSTKIPQTQQGMTILRNAIIQTCEQAVSNGVAGTGNTWNGETFGVVPLFLSSISNNGYYIYQIPISQQSQADRAARKAPLFQVALKLAGAVHSVDVIVIIEQ